MHFYETIQVFVCPRYSFQWAYFFFKREKTFCVFPFISNYIIVKVSEGDKKVRRRLDWASSAKWRNPLTRSLERSAREGITSVSAFPTWVCLFVYFFTGIKSAVTSPSPSCNDEKLSEKWRLVLSSARRSKSGREIREECCRRLCMNFFFFSGDRYTAQKEAIPF